MKELKFKKLITSAGVPLYVLEMPQANTVAAGVLVRVGTRDEVWPKQAGLAHALEHMVFQGTKNFANSQKLTAYIEEVGGYTNAFTSMEGTFFYCCTPTEHEERIFVFLDELINRPLIPAKKISTEMHNIVEEIKMNEDDPPRFIYNESQKVIFQGHPLGKKTLGEPQSVLSFQRQDFKEFLVQYYNNQNFILVVAGRITAKQALAYFEKIFKGSEKGIANVRDKKEVKEYKKRKFITRRQGIQQVQVILGVPAAPSGSKDSLALNIYGDMLDGGTSFPLFQELRDKRGLCYSTSVLTSRYSDASSLDIYIGTDVKRYKQAAGVAVKLIQQHKKDRDLLRRAKELKLGQLALKYESSLSVLQIAAFDIIQDGKPKSFGEIKKEIRSVRIKDVTKAVEKYLRPSQIRQILLLPKK